MQSDGELRDIGHVRSFVNDIDIVEMLFLENWKEVDSDV